MNLTSSFLLHSDKLAIGPHLLLAPAVVKPAVHEFAHRPNPIQENASQCPKQNRKSELYSVCGNVTYNLCSISRGRKLEEVEVGCVVGKEGVQVPGEAVPLIKGVTSDMARDGVS